MAISQKVLCQVNNLKDHGEHVYTIGLISERKFPIFKPGQFLHLALDPYDPSGFWPDSRVFSIASPPQLRDCLSITYSVRGRFTTRMEKELSVGKTVWIKMPYGEFIIQALGDIVLLAGGTGITAFTAFLSGLMPKSNNRVFLAYGARNANLLIYRDLVEQYAINNNQIRPYYFVEEEQIDPTSKRSEILGKISINEIWNRIENPYEVSFYLSGPPAMIHMLSNDLEKRGVRDEFVHVDAWE